MKQLAHQLLWDILDRIYPIALAQELSSWPLIFCVNALLIMGIEAIQYADARIGFHAALDMSSGAANIPASSSRQPTDDKAFHRLLHFYQLCFTS